jgi:hypothetical protein
MVVNPNLLPGELAYLSDLHTKHGEDLYLYTLNNQSEIGSNHYIETFK